MSSNPFMDYQQQFFKMWEDNMGKMLDSDAYKAMMKNVPGADAYAKAMESMIPNVENYWKNMASAMPQMPGMDFWSSSVSNMMGANPFMDYWKNMAGKLPDEEVAAAIAMAFDMEQGGDTFAAIAMALHLYLTESVHDNESFILTIQPTPASGWNDKFQKFRKLPR